MARGLFVIGTDTGVGKTTVSVSLLGALRHRGLRVAAMKPCETGGGDDAERLLRATGRSLDPALVNPFAYALPASPELASRREGRAVGFAVIESAFRQLAADADLSLVEGAGGLLVPLTREHTIADLVARLDLPVLLVARTKLGTINHTLLTIEVARARGLRILGVVFCQTHRRAGPEETESPSSIEQLSGLRSFGTLPWLSARARQDERQLVSIARQHLDVASLVAAISAA